MTGTTWHDPTEADLIQMLRDARANARKFKRTTRDQFIAYAMREIQARPIVEHFYKQELDDLTPFTVLGNTCHTTAACKAMESARSAGDHAEMGRLLDQAMERAERRACDALLEDAEELEEAGAAAKAWERDVAADAAQRAHAVNAQFGGAA